MPKKTAFYEKHLARNAKIVEFAGFFMPLQYEGIIPEHEAVRTGVGVFDVSHMGEVEIRGKDRLPFVNYITTNDATKLAIDQVQYSAMLYPDGGIVDDLLVYNLADRALLVINAANTAKDVKWMSDNKRFDVSIIDTSDALSQLAIQGPKAEPVVQKIVNFDLRELPFYWARETEIAGTRVVLSRTGYTGEDGFEVYIANEHAVKLWDLIFDAGREFNIKPVGLGARDTLRFEVRYCLYGNDIDQTTNPLEAGLGWIVKMDKGDFIGRDAVAAVKAAGVSRKLVGFEALTKGIPRPHLDITDRGRKIGHVTSGTYSPSLKKGIGMGYVETGYSEPGTKIVIAGKEPVDARVVKGPFYKTGSRK